MNYITEHITADKIIGSEKTQIMKEGEISLSEQSPDIDIILKCDAKIIPEDNYIEEDKLNYKLTLVITALYCGKDKSIHSASEDVLIEEFINIDGAKEDMYSFIYPSITHIECKKLNNRKLTYKVMAEVKGVVTQSAEIDAITDLYDIPKDQQLLKNITTPKTLSKNKECVSLTEDVAIPATKLPIQEILSVTTNISNPEYKPLEDGVEFSGDVSVTLLYTSTEGGFPELFEFDLPFNFSLDAINTELDSIVDVNSYIKDCFYNVSENEDGEPRLLNLEINICSDIHTCQIENHEVLDDAYSTNNQINFTTTTLCYSNIVCRNKGQCPVKEVITLDEKCPDMLQIFRATGTVYTDDINIYENKVVLSGAINVDIMYITGNDDIPIYCYSDTIPFKQNIDSRGAKETMEATVNANIAHIGFNMLSDRELEVRCALNTSTTVRDKTCIDLITGVEVTPLPQDVIDKIPSIIIYTVKKGDTLWKLSKKFNTTIKSIANINNIENPDLIYPNQKLIIVKGA